MKVKRNGGGTATRSKAQPLTVKEQKALKANPGCIAKGSPKCPAISGLSQPYHYQLGCRADACTTANHDYYKAWRDKQKKLAERQLRKAQKSRNAKKSAIKKRVR